MTYIAESLADLWRELEDLRERAANGNATLDEDEPERLKSLKRLEDALDGQFADYASEGESLIYDSDFREYAQDLAEELDLIPDNLCWPLTCIDWEQAARELQYDYTSVEWEGTQYWVRSI